MLQAGRLPSFLGAPWLACETEVTRAHGAKAVVLGVPFDQATVYRSGSSHGPRGLRQASEQYLPYLGEYDIDLFEAFRLADCGDVPIVPGDAARSRKLIADRVGRILDGQALVARFGADGWQVAAAAHRGGEFAADLADPELVARLVERVLDRFGRLDALIVNHASMALAAVDEHDPIDWWRIVDTNLSGAFYLARDAAPYLITAEGSIVFISSEWGVSGWPRATAYAASKAGLIGLTRALARELAPMVRVNALAPGAIDTPQLEVDARDARVSIAEIRARYARGAPLQRIGTPA